MTVSASWNIYESGVTEIRSLWFAQGAPTILESRNYVCLRMPVVPPQSAGDDLSVLRHGKEGQDV